MRTSLAALLLALSVPVLAQPVPAPVAAPASSRPAPSAPGVWSVRKQGDATRLVVTGKAFTSREAIEQYLAWRTAEHVMAAKARWFSFVERRMAGDKVVTPKPDAEGQRYSFRLEYFRPTWRYKTAGSPDWKVWRPLAGAPFFASTIDPKTISDYEVSADIIPRSGMLVDYDPLAFDASAVSDYLINQVTTPR
jgi:hypothetical protein